MKACICDNSVLKSACFLFKRWQDRDTQYSYKIRRFLLKFLIHFSPTLWTLNFNTYCISYKYHDITSNMIYCYVVNQQSTCLYFHIGSTIFLFSRMSIFLCHTLMPGWFIMTSSTISCVQILNTLVECILWWRFWRHKHNFIQRCTLVVAPLHMICDRRFCCTTVVYTILALVRMPIQWPCLRNNIS